MSAVDIAEHDLDCFGCDCDYMDSTGKWVEPKTCLTCRCRAALAELEAARDAALARAEAAEADQQREIENNIALAAERDEVAVLNEALEKRIAEGTEAWGIYRDGQLERVETKITHCHAMDVRRVVILDGEEQAMKIGLMCCDCEREVDDAEPYALRCHACESKQGAELARLTGEIERLRAVAEAAREVERLIVDPNPRQDDWLGALAGLRRAVKALDDAPKGE